MNEGKIKFLIYYTLCIWLSLITFALAEVVIVPIEGTIDLGLVPLIERSVKLAEEKNAEAIIFKINTFGGRVDAATAIKNVIINTDRLTVAFIDKEAISAGALISLANKKIIMTPGAAFGAATPVDGSGAKASEKVVSFMRSEMRATAETNKRRTDIAEAMVDETISIPEIVAEGKLLTLTANEAFEIGYCDTIVTSLKDALRYLQLAKQEQITIKENWAENIVRFLTNPMVSSLLLSLGFLGLFYELISPGWGVSGTVGIIILALFFGSHYIINLAEISEILIFSIGVILLLIEIFLIPGFGVTGIIGIVCIIIGIFLSLLGIIPDIKEIQHAIYIFSGSLLLTSLTLLLSWKFIPKTTFWSKIQLKEEIRQEDIDIKNENVTLLDELGVAMTDLRPSGTAFIKNRRVDVISEGDYIEKNGRIRVIRVEGNRVVVIKEVESI